MENFVNEYFCEITNKLYLCMVGRSWSFINKSAMAEAENQIHINLPPRTPPPPLGLQIHRSDNWKLWKRPWDNSLIVSGLEAKPPKYIVALLLDCIDKDALRLYNGMDTSNDDRKDHVIIIKTFDENILGETKEFFERYIFNTCDQKIWLLNSITQPSGIWNGHAAFVTAWGINS